MDLSIVLLAYKEEENLRVLLPKIIENVDNLSCSYEIVVVDTATPTDNTEDVCRDYGAKYVNQVEPGFGGAYRKGIETALGDAVLFLDSDGSHDPAYIEGLYRKYHEGYDVVVGSRYCKGGVSNDKFFSKILSRILNVVFRLVTGVKARDLSTNFRVYKGDCIRSLDLKSVNYDVLEEILLLMKLRKGNRNFKIAEIPIVFNKRIFGYSKRKMIPFIISYIKTVFRLLSIRIKNRGK